MKEDYDIALSHESYELHPEVPEEGMLLSAYFPDAKVMLARTQAFASQHGIVIKDVDYLPNTNKILRVFEYAKTLGKGEALVKATFDAIFLENVNISHMKNIVAVCHKVGLTEESVKKALEDPAFVKKLEDNRRVCQTLKINSLPTMIINDHIRLVGAQSPEALKNIFDGQKTL